METNEESLMNIALSLAGRGGVNAQPNPMVGAVIVSDGEIVGEGYHERVGEAHAEIRALEQAGGRAGGGTMYVTLEPCCHHGRTPPCTEAIMSAGIKRVVCCDTDPNPRVNGRGLKILAEAGISVSHGLLREAERRLNEVYYKYIASGSPFVTLKMAQSLDGFISLHDSSGWITGPIARRVVHEMRASHLAVMVGIGTVLDDDPTLDIRCGRHVSSGYAPLRVIIDSNLRLAPGMAVVDTAHGYPTRVYTSCDKGDERAVHLRDGGLEVVQSPRRNGEGLDLAWIMKDLGEGGISSVLVEGGKRLATSLLREGFVDKLVLFVNPSIAGEGAGVPGFGMMRMNENENDLRRSVELDRVEVAMAGGDILVSGYPRIREM